MAHAHRALACLALGIDYLDLADGSDFVKGIAQFDAAAKARGVCILSAVSSFPVLTAAVVRRLTRGMTRLDRVTGGIAPSPYAGIPVSIKDLFDIRGQVTRAGSRALEDSPPAEADATVVARLRRAGFIVIGRTNMTEFAYSGIGINPHYGTPKSAWQRNVGHVPGGSSSGAAVSIADGMAYGALGTDTGGSCRIPAAYNGIVGFKPTQRRVPLEGGIPLSFSLDSFGPLARSVGCCAVLDAVLADEPVQPLQTRPVRGMRLAVPTTVALDGLDDDVATTFERALETLSRAGALI